MRLVEYSDSSEDDEQEWREFHRQRSTFRRTASGFAAAPTVGAGVGQGSSAQPHPLRRVSAPVMSNGPSRDFTFTRRPTALGPRDPPRASPVPAQVLSPTPDFSFSPTVSPMSDDESIAASTGTAAPQPAPFVFGAASPSPSSSSVASPFAMSRQGSRSTPGSALAAGPFTRVRRVTPGRTPLSQKDLHRAAKRRGSAASAGLFSFGTDAATTESPMSSASTTTTTSKPTPNISKESPFVSQAAGFVDTGTSLSPIDIEMDESSAAKSPIGSAPPMPQADAMGGLGDIFGVRSTRSDSRSQGARTRGRGRGRTSNQPISFRRPYGAGREGGEPSAFRASSQEPLKTTGKEVSPEHVFFVGSSGFPTAFATRSAQAEDTSSPEFKDAPSPPRTFGQVPIQAADIDHEPLDGSASSVKGELGRADKAKAVFSGSSSAPFTSSSFRTAPKALFQTPDTSHQANVEAKAAFSPFRQTASTSIHGRATRQKGGSLKNTTSAFGRSPFAGDQPDANNSSNLFDFSASSNRKKPTVGVGKDNVKPLGHVFPRTSTSSEDLFRQPEPSPPPVEKLKSNFDTFQIGVTEPPTAKRGSARKKSNKPRSGAAANTLGGSPFGLNAKPPHQATLKTNVFGSPPANPFVTPTFRRTRNDHLDDATNQTAFSTGDRPTVPSTTVSGDEKYDARTSPPASKDQCPDENDQRTKSPPRNLLNEYSYMAGRRVVRAGQQFKPQPASSSSTSSSPQADKSDEDDWGKWKELGGQAYSRREYVQAADCYLQSVIALESAAFKRPELMTVQLRKDKAKLHCNRAAALIMLMQLSEAQRECELSIEMDAKYVRAYLRLGRIQVMTGDTEKAKENADIAKRLLSHDEDDSADRRDAADVMKIESAVDKLGNLRGQIKWHTQVRDYSRALTYLHDALVIAPRSREFRTEKAQILFAQKNYSQVVEYCNNILRKEKGVEAKAHSASASTGRTNRDTSLLGIDLCMLRIRALHYQNKLDEASLLLAALERAAPCSDKVIGLKRCFQEMKDLKHQANELFKAGNYETAQAVYTRALTADPQHDEYCAVIYCNRAAALMGLQKYESALLDCDAALRRKAHYPRALLRRARCNVALKKYAVAISDFDRYLKEHPSDSKSESSFAVNQEKIRAREAMEKEAEERRKEAQRNQEQHRQKQSNRNRSRHRNAGRQYAWDDTSFNDDFRRTQNNGNAREQTRGAGSAGNRGAGSNGTHPSKLQRRSHYDVLGLQKTATQAEIKKAYRKLALLYHPDKAKDTKQADLFKDMTAAYNVLSDASSRARYDREMQYGGFGRYYEY